MPCCCSKVLETDDDVINVVGLVYFDELRLSRDVLCCAALLGFGVCLCAVILTGCTG